MNKYTVELSKYPEIGIVWEVCRWVNCEIVETVFYTKSPWKADEECDRLNKKVQEDENA